MNLPRRQQQLYDLLLGRGDVLIAALYVAMDGPESMSAVTRTQQQWLSPYVTALNASLADHKLKVEPGALKNTYRLVKL